MSPLAPPPIDTTKGTGTGTTVAVSVTCQMKLPMTHYRAEPPAPPFTVWADVSVLRMFMELERDLDELKGLPTGWDGARARPIPYDTLSFAKEVFAALVRPGIIVPHVVPTVKGGVQLEWHSAAADVEVTIVRRGEIKAYVVDTRSDEDDLIEVPTAAALRQQLDQRAVRLTA